MNNNNSESLCKHGPLIPRLDGNFCCLRCKKQICAESIKNIRIAQYGGIMPGSGSASNGGSGGGQFNVFQADTSLDGLMSRSHHPAPVDPTRNMEKRLEMFHQYAEDDLIPYNLTPKERARLKIRKDVRRREKDLADCAKSIKENSVSFIKNHYDAKPEQLMTMEQQLASRHRNEIAEKDRISKGEPAIEDVMPKNDPPSRRHVVEKPNFTNVSAKTQQFLSLLRTANNDIYRQPNRLQSENNDLTTEDDASGYLQGKHKAPEIIGNMTTTNSGAEVDQNLYSGKEATDNWGGQFGPNVDKQFWDDNYVAEEGEGQHKDIGQSLPSSVPSSPVDNIQLTTEGKLNQLTKDRKNQRLPKDDSNNDDAYSRYRKQPESIADKFQFSGGDLGPSYGGGRLSQKSINHLSKLVISSEDKYTFVL